MPLPLFPADGTPITIKQGNAGDCYLLVSLDCILNEGPSGLAKIKSMFEQKDDGSVILRVKHSEISKYLNLDIVKKKQQYVYDATRNEDVFILSPERVEQLSQEKIGVQSNSLAVVILEHLSSYYYVRDFSNPVDPLASVLAHNVGGRHATTSTDFMGKFLNVAARDTESFDDVIKLKKIHPEQPVYFSMNYHGLGRHALRLDSIVQSEDGTYTLVLINPHDNQIKETHTLGQADILKLKPRFCIFNTNDQLHTLIPLILKMSEKDGQLIFQDVALKKILLDLQKLDNLKVSDLGSILELYRDLPGFRDIYTSLSHDAKFSLLRELRLNGAKGIRANQVWLRNIFDEALRCAVKEKAQKDAEETILFGLVRYYFLGGLEYITRAGNLRQLISDGFFSKDDLKQFIAPQIFNQNVLLLAFQKDRDLSIFSNYFAHCRLAITSEFKMDLCMVLMNLEVNEVKHRLDVIRKNNPELAEELTQIDSRLLPKPKPVQHLVDKKIDPPKPLLVEHKVRLMEQHLEPEVISNPLLKRPKESAKRRLNEVERSLPIKRVRFKPSDETPFMPVSSPVKVNADVSPRQQVLPQDLVKRNVVSDETSHSGKYARQVLDDCQFMTHLSLIIALSHELKEKSLHDQSHIKAALAAEKLVEILTREKNILLSAIGPIQSSAKVFQRHCLAAIDEAIPSLKKHAGWQQALVNLANVLVTILTLGLANLMVGRWAFFSIKTEAEKTVESMAVSVRGLEA